MLSCPEREHSWKINIGTSPLSKLGNKQKNADIVRGVRPTGFMVYLFDLYVETVHKIL